MASRGAEGSLTVTATIVASVGVMVGPDGQQKLVYANSVDPRDNVSNLQPVRTVLLTPPANTASQPKPSKTKKKGSDG